MSYTLTSPIPGTPRVTSPYGWRTIFGRRSFHRGIDLAGPPNNNQPLYMPDLTGTVTHVRYQANGFGWYVYIKLDNGMGLTYAHQSRPNVRVGQRVDYNTIIGYCGATGLATGVHLHLELHRRHGGGFTQSNAVNFIITPRKMAQKQRDFYHLIRTERPDVWKWAKGSHSAIRWWWDNHGQWEFRRALAGLRRADIWKYEVENPSFDLANWYVLYGHKDHPGKNIWHYMKK